MTLQDYIKKFPAGFRSKECARIAQELNVSASHIRGIVAGLSPMPSWMAIPIEQLTNGKVKVHESCPSHYPVPYNWRGHSRKKQLGCQQ